MARHKLTKQAERDLLEIWVYVAENNFEAADELTDLLKERCRTLADTPGMGRPRDELLPGLRSIVEGKYVILYRKQPYGVSIERIVHGSRQIEYMFPGNLDEQTGNGTGGGQES